VKRLLALWFVVIAAACSGSPAAPWGPASAVAFPGGTIAAKVASTIAARDTGLMHVTSLGANDGMLFVFGVDHVPADCAFWMKDTPVALSIAFIDANMKVINIDEMAAETTVFHQPTGACRFALEANKGWMTAHGVAAGTTVSFTLPAGTIIDP
jgi:uncharacterized membrane protein (UPF0127 family)